MDQPVPAQASNPHNSIAGSTNAAQSIATGDDRTDSGYQTTDQLISSLRVAFQAGHSARVESLLVSLADKSALLEAELFDAKMEIGECRHENRMLRLKNVGFHFSVVDLQNKVNSLECEKGQIGFEIDRLKKNFRDLEKGVFLSENPVLSENPGCVGAPGNVVIIDSDDDS